MESEVNLAELYRALRQEFITQTRRIAELEVQNGHLTHGLQTILHGTADPWAKSEAARALGHDNDDPEAVYGTY